MKRIFLPVCLSMLIAAGGCSNFSIPFFGDKDKDYPRAFYVKKQASVVDERKEIRMSGTLPEIVNLIQAAMDTVFDTTSYTLRINSSGSRIIGPRPIMEVVTPELVADSLGEFEQYFNKGNYILDKPGIDVKADGLTYKIESLVKMDGNTFLITFNAEGSIDWNIYRARENKSDTVIVAEDEEKMYGVGQYRFQEEKTYINRRGQEDTFKVWRQVPIEDQPTSRLYLEQKLRQKIIEMAAYRGIEAAQRPVR